MRRKGGFVLVGLVLAAWLAVHHGMHATVATLRGRVAVVLDGDTVTLLDTHDRRYRIRLAEIDAPEISHGRDSPGQPFGRRSKQSLASLIFGREVSAECESVDQYGRDVCTIMVDGTDANLEQVRSGMAWVYRRYARNPEYYLAEWKARWDDRGLWADSDPVAPWEWRHHRW